MKCRVNNRFRRERAIRWVHRNKDRRSPTFDYSVQIALTGRSASLDFAHVDGDGVPRQLPQRLMTPTGRVRVGRSSVSSAQRQPKGTLHEDISNPSYSRDSASASEKKLRPTRAPRPANHAAY